MSAILSFRPPNSIPLSARPRFLVLCLRRCLNSGAICFRLWQSLIRVRCAKWLLMAEVVTIWPARTCVIRWVWSTCRICVLIMCNSWATKRKSRWTIWCMWHFLLGNTPTLWIVMSYLWWCVTCSWDGHGNMTVLLFTMGVQIATYFDGTIWMSS